MSDVSKPTAEASPDHGHFPVVGIGASAGGLQAFRELVERLPADTGMAFVLVSHLDPGHPSMMSEVLGHSTDMQVREVRGGAAPMAPNNVYVIAPNTVLTIADGRLEVATADDVRIRRACIDHFFRSLAAALQERAIGILLSGSGSDGAEGVRAIKEAGGIAFAQDDSATFPEMPKAAIATGCVDFVLPPAGIAGELARIARHPFVTAERPAGAPASAGEQRVLALLRGATGMDFTDYKPTTIRRRMARRMAVRHIDDLGVYLKCLEDHPEEVRALHDDLLINVTRFFREPEAFAVLRERVFPALLRDRAPDDPIRIWVPGCSTGEEAYSLAIALVEHFEETRSTMPVQIFGTDVTESAVLKARAGGFEPGIVSDLSPERLRRFFVPNVRGGYQISRAIRDMCVFARQDVTRDPPFSRLDLLSCRNLLIYLGPGLQRRVLPLFHYALKPNGFLLLGSSETVGPFTNLFSSFDKGARIYVKVAASPPARLDLFAPDAARRALATSPRELEERAPPFDVGREADRLLLAQFVPPSIVVNAAGDILHVRGDTAPFLRPAPGKPSLHLIKMAREDLVVEIERAMRDVCEKGTVVRRDEVPVQGDGRWRNVSVEVAPMRGPASEAYFLVLFHEEQGVESPRRPKGAGRNDPRDLEVARLRQELLTARAYHQTMLEKYEATNEALRAAHEEVLSANEELQSTNEELETAKEKLQSTNEELGTVNEELQHRNDDLGRLNGDLENVFASVNVPIAVVDSGLRLRRFTGAAERLFNILPTDVNRRITDFNHNFVARDLERRLVGVVDDITPADEEIQDRDGHWYALRVRPYRSGENHVDGAVITLTDIHALKTNLLEASRNRGFMESIVEAAPEAILVLDRGLHVRLANEAWYRGFATARAETEGKSIFELCGGALDLPELRGGIESVVTRGGCFDGLETTRSFDGHDPRTLVISGRQIDPERGGDCVALLTLNDVTAHRQAQAERLRSEARFSAIFDQVLVGIALIDPNGRFGLVNHRFCEIAGRREPELVGARHEDLVHPDDLVQSREVFDRLASEGQRLGVEYRLVRPDGVEVWVSADASLVHDPAGRPDYVLVSVQATTERKRAEASLRERTAELEEAVRDLTSFSSTISHDLRAPLRAMASYAHIVTAELEGKAPPGKGRDAARRIEVAARRMDALVESLLSYSRLGRMELLLEPVELDEVAACVVKDIAEEAGQAGLEIERPLGRVRAHRDMLGPVLANLLRNAVKFVAPGVVPEVRVRSERRDAKVRVWVEDNGIGIAPQYQERVFGVFDRLHTVEEYPGTGIGLAIVRRSIERMGGAVGVESEPGKGSRFWFELPAATG